MNFIPKSKFFNALLLLLLAVSCGSPSRSGRPAVSPAATLGGVDAAWDEMQQALQGRWRAVTADKRTINTSYRTVSKGSAMVETFRTASGTETITVFHRDGNALMLTHYCAQGNQVRLKATETTRDRIVFEFVDATNVRSGQGVMQRLVFTFRVDGFDQESVYLDNGTLDSTVLHFSRAVPGEGEVAMGKRRVHRFYVGETSP